MASLLARLFGLHRYSQPTLPAVPRAPILPTPDTRFVATPASPVPLKNWCHPFKDKQRSKDTRNPLEQLTHLAKAAGGYYPVGRSGLFHGGIHFDGGTAGTLDQSSVRCLADGEVVAYRIDTHAPTTRYYVGQMTVDKPFSRNFVLVRHRLQPPRIEGSADIPPSLTFYSLYMHLQDWAKYEKDDALERPAYWPASPILRVPQTAKDIRPGTLEYGLNVRHQPSQGKVIDFLPRGAEVSVSGTGAYRRLENRQGPAKLITAEGSLAGYLAASLLQPVGGSEYRVTSSQPSVNVRAQPSLTSEVLLQLPTGSVVTVSGEGDFRKLERVNQYVHFASLESELAPQATDRIVVLDQPVPIQAGALIGHLGEYQDMRAERPEEKLHLEVFTGDDVDLFLDASRAWAERLPAKERTWLKLVEGTPVVPHEEPATAARLQASSDASPRSAADLLVPKSVLDSLPSEGKIHVPATGYRKARNWYRLNRLLHDADHNLLDGWVCEEVGVTPWLSPWSWEGYGVIFDYSTPRHEMASFFSAVGRFNDAQRERFRPLAEKNNQGPMKSRLYAIIDRNRDGKITAEELQAALRLPALAQAISQMILRKESEWFHQTPKWDALDELLGHSGSTPHWNWEAEKQRIEQISWWGEVAQTVGLPAWGRPYHFHPVGLAVRFKGECPKECTVETYKLESADGLLVVSKESFELILEQEGYSEYPYVPAGASGVTVGYGYDLGQQTIAQVRHDLADVYSQLDIEALIAVVGKQGEQARSALGFVGHISISKENALVLAVRMKRRYAQLVISVYPGVLALHPHCQGVLLSIVVNRGNSFTQPNADSRLEMKQISDDLLGLVPEKIPFRIRSMKRLWEGKVGLRGLIVRREEEAKLFERGLKCDCWD